MEFLKVANGLPMLIICALIVIIVIAQPIIMSLMARKRALQIGMTNGDVKKVIKSTALFSIIPSVPILASYLILVPALGKYFPWMRLSVVGSVTYETMVANMAAESFDYANIYNTDFPVGVFLSILLILTLGILGGNIFNLIFLKSYEKGVRKLMERNAVLIPVITSAVFVALYGTLSAPTLTNIGNPVAILTFLVAGGVAVLVNHIAKTHPKMKEHAFTISLLAGMIFACLINPLF
ncbi:DUF5058 family protein [Enterococcus pallens]|uniref:DUF5058 family protein n=1 Tax=Enterococcus pallens ATCC BAA-351 TaxID=1158607 RepID=R2QNK3_9ENTE|nr:DUF5058 family protein [Enterococcus pallens]EOH98107.1 hypothetical protein UAU_00781 [Enterococcus pallens ATCC BAA-351]EOU14645.1 hypothetical protein I588_05004 [Enterococcus pallens ATCC BAA-351]OJG77241.1 hypothetical protein RV10_GL002639 [Enterococcus pallens]